MRPEAPTAVPSVPSPPERDARTGAKFKEEEKHMRRLIIAALIATMLGGSVAIAKASEIPEDSYVDGFSHPLRVVGYLVSPVGFAAEWLVFRPLHYIISRPDLSNVFNYDPNEDVDIRF
jgi:hypothetical protein